MISAKRADYLEVVMPRSSRKIAVDDEYWRRVPEERLQHKDRKSKRPLWPAKADESLGWVILPFRV